MLRRPLVLLSACGAAFNAQAAEVEIALTEEVIQATYITDGALVGLERSDLAIGLLFSDDRDIVVEAGLMIPGLGQGGLAADVIPGPISVRFGARAYGALLSDPSDDVFGIAPGAEARYTLPTGLPMTAVANVFYAPDIIVFGDADDIVDFNARLEVQFVERATGFVGYRLLTFDRDAGEDDIVENIQIGARFAF